MATDPILTDSAASPAAPPSMLMRGNYDATEVNYFRKHVINLNRGLLGGSDGKYQTSLADLEALFKTHLPAALKASKSAGQPLRLLFWAHGGLVSEGDALGHVLSHGKIWESAGIYPVYFVWETGLMETLKGIAKRPRDRGISDVWDTGIEAVTRGAGTKAWGEMKSYASIASAAQGGADLAATLLRDFYHGDKSSILCFACGHSAGSIFHSHWLPLLAGHDIPIEELFLLAPAVTIDEFADRLSTIIGKNRPIRRSSMFTMFDNLEQDDSVGPYRKSLLYLVSRAFETRREQPILGMETSLRGDIGMRRFWGIDSPGIKGDVEIVFSKSDSDPVRSSTSTSHGGFDNDPATLNSVMRRILGKPGASGRFTTENSRGSGSRAAYRVALGAPSAREPKVLEPTIRLHYGSFTSNPPDSADTLPIDCRVAGHYDGVDLDSIAWVTAEAILDQWVSGVSPGDPGSRKEGIISSRTRRGVMTGDLGQTTIIQGGKGLAAFLGLGRYGTLGQIELTAAVRELCLQLADTGVKHLGAVLIGSGAGNLSATAAFDAWFDGIHLAQSEAGFSLTHVTFFELDPMRFLKLEEAAAVSLAGFQTTAESPLISPAVVQAAQKAAMVSSVTRAEKEIFGFQQRRKDRAVGKSASVPDEWRKPTSRITVLADKEHYVFTALTENAAIPERIIGVDPALMDEIGLAIARAENPATLAEWGETLRRLVIPRDLEGKLFSSSSHLVFTVDQTTARVPWEMMVVPAPLSAAIGGAGTATPSREFLGLSTGYGLTRQLQTRFAPAPAQAGDPRQQLSVLIVADPGMNLPAAREEGIMLSKLFTQYGAEVTLLSDQQATPAGLANLLANRSYDILLFAGHCFYNPEQPEASGWIFDHEGKRVFSARELQRFNTPPFVFSNACESGVTPDERSVANLRIGPCFAEAFFAQGVTNFVCTAWPIRDESALSFTRTFYETMLLEGGPGHINLAMLNARQSIVESDPHTAGAYHHYGNPFFQFRRPPTGILPTLAAAGQLAPGKAAVNKKADKETTKKITKKIAKKMARKAAEKKLTPG